MVEPEPRTELFSIPLSIQEFLSKARKNTWASGQEPEIDKETGIAFYLYIDNNNLQFIYTDECKSNPNAPGRYDGQEIIVDDRRNTIRYGYTGTLTKEGEINGANEKLKEMLKILGDVARMGKTLLYETREKTPNGINVWTYKSECEMLLKGWKDVATLKLNGKIVHTFTGVGRTCLV